jgi:DNA replication protein DnaC
LIQRLKDVGLLLDSLVLDDFGLLPLDSHSRAILMEIIEDRHGKRSTIIASQLPVQQWYDIIGEASIADAISDRLVHDAHRIELESESLRKRNKVEPVEVFEIEE